MDLPVKTGNCKKDSCIAEPRRIHAAKAIAWRYIWQIRATIVAWDSFQRSSNTAHFYRYNVSLLVKVQRGLIK